MTEPKKGYKPGVYRLVSGTVDSDGDFSITNIPKEGYVAGIYKLTEVTIESNGDTSSAEDDTGISRAITVTVDSNGDLSETSNPQEGYVPGICRVTTSTNIPKEGLIDPFTAVSGSISSGVWGAGAATYTSEVTDFFENVTTTQSIVGRTVETGTYDWATYNGSGETNEDSTTDDLRTTATGTDVFRAPYINLDTLANAPTKVEAKFLNSAALAKGTTTSFSIILHYEDDDNYVAGRLLVTGTVGTMTCYIEEYISGTPSIKATSSSVAIGAAFNSYPASPITLREDNGKTYFDATIYDAAFDLVWNGVSSNSSKRVGCLFAGSAVATYGMDEIEVCSSP